MLQHVSTALLESPLRVDVDVNSFRIGEATIPLEVAAFKLSLPLTQILLAHGADANAQHGFHTTVLDAALATVRSHKRVWTVQHYTELILMLCDSDMKEAAAVVTTLLAAMYSPKPPLHITYSRRNKKNAPNVGNDELEKKKRNIQRAKDHQLGGATVLC